MTKKIISICIATFFIAMVGSVVFAEEASSGTIELTGDFENSIFNYDYPADLVVNWESQEVTGTITFTDISWGWGGWNIGMPTIYTVTDGTFDLDNHYMELTLENNGDVKNIVGSLCEYQTPDRWWKPSYTYYSGYWMEQTSGLPWWMIDQGIFELK